CHLDYETVLCGKAEVVHLALVFNAEKQPSARQTPFAFGLVLDNSGSMAGQPLDHAKSAATMVLKHLRDDDWFSLVVFSNSARTVIPLQIAADKARLQAVIADIHDEGSTNLTAGWMLGRDEVAKAPADLPRKILLLTDGQLNEGVVEPAQVRQIVGSGLEKERIRTSCLGFGDEYNEDLLNELSKAASGALHDAASPEKFPAIFRQELESLLALSAQNLRVRVRKLHYCSGVAILSDYPIVALPEGGIEIMIGDLVSDEQRVLVLALEVLPIPPLADGTPAASIEGEALLEIEVAYDELTEAGITSKTEQRTIRLSAVQNSADVRVNAQVVEWVAAQEVGRTISEAIVERDRGDMDAVERRLKSTTEKLERYGCAASTGKAMRNLTAFEEAAAEWGPRARKTSTAFSSRSRKTSSYYEAESLDDQSGKQPPNATPPLPERPDDDPNLPASGA
ncbi:MAG: VWA domain-containing protein, partial [Chthoniobacteraceae bacterium]